MVIIIRIMCNINNVFSKYVETRAYLSYFFPYTLTHFTSYHFTFLFPLPIIVCLSCLLLPCLLLYVLLVFPFSLSSVYILNSLPSNINMSTPILPPPPPIFSHFHSLHLNLNKLQYQSTMRLLITNQSPIPLQYNPMKLCVIEKKNIVAR